MADRVHLSNPNSNPTGQLTVELVLAHPDSPGKRAVKRVCVSVPSVL